MSRLAPDRWRAASAHLDELLDTTPADRAARLDLLRHTDPQVADDVRALLAAHEAVNDRQFLEVGPPPPPGSGPGVGSTVGSYRLVSLIGHGGMGSVWLGERADGRFEGQAAIKLLNSGFMDSAGERRFRREGTILARLTHPHIARLVDAGVSDTGRPYLVLEYINGAHINDYCLQHRLSVKQTLRLFLDVLSAVAHAHANLIVHRDLKPSNVLVTTDGQVKLLDFGIAKLIRAESDTTTEAARTRDPGGLTPRYASPEQMLGQPITTATDVYALGVLLYGLLAGHHPAGDGPLAPAELIKMIVEQDAPPVSAAVVDPARRKVLAGDVDRLVAKALAKDPAGRYATITAFADDIRRFLRHEPISARPDTWSYRTVRFIRRRRRVLAAAAVITLAAASLTAYYGVQLRRERDRATLEAQKAQRISQLMTSLLTGADPYRNPGPEGPSVLALLDAGAERVDAELADQPALRAEMLTIIGRVYMRMGRSDRARPLLETAVQLNRSLSPEGTVALAQALNDFGVFTRDSGDAATGRTMLEESLAMRRRLLGPRHADVAITLVELARAFKDLGLPAESEAPTREALAIRLEVFGDHHRETATSQNELALLLWERGQLDEAESLFRQNVETNRILLGETHTSYGTALSNLSLVLAATQRGAEAETLVRTALSIQQAALGADSVTTAHTWYNLSGALLAQGRTADAVAAAQQAVTLGAARLDPDHPRLATFQLGLGRALVTRGQPAAALPLLQHAFDIRRRSLVARDWRLAQVEGLVGAALFDLRRYQDAAPHLTAANRDLADVPGPFAHDKQLIVTRLSSLPAALRSVQ
jgi:serine/threonine protein kinase